MDTSIGLVQDASVTLSQLPYTGFDYGEAYNSAFWVVLTLWSLLVSMIFVKHKDFFARNFAGLSKVFIVSSRGHSVETLENEPVILQERIVKPQTPVQEYVPPVAKEEYVPPLLEVDIDTQKFVQGVVAKELVVSREGQTPDEFSSDDFATVDFDGVNPDDAWKPRGVYKIPMPQSPHHDTDPKEQQTQQSEQYTPPTRVVERVEKQSEVFIDTLVLDKSGEYPKMVLTRLPA